MFTTNNSFDKLTHNRHDSNPVYTVSYVHISFV